MSTLHMGRRERTSSHMRIKDIDSSTHTTELAFKVKVEHNSHKWVCIFSWENKQP